MFKLIDAEITCTTPKVATVRCTILVLGEYRRRCFDFPLSCMEQVNGGIFVQDWLIDNRAQEYRAMFGNTCTLMAEPAFEVAN